MGEGEILEGDGILSLFEREDLDIVSFEFGDDSGEIIGVFGWNSGFGAEGSFVDSFAKLDAFVWQAFVWMGRVASVYDAANAESISGAQDSSDVVDGADVP